MLSERQRRIVWCGLALFVLACLVPPWRLGSVTSGYHLIFAPPECGSVDVTRLGIQLLAVVVVTAVLVLLTTRGD